MPKDAVYCWNFLTPANTGIETYYFEESNLPANAEDQINEQIKAEILEVTPEPYSSAASANNGADTTGTVLARILRWAFLLIVAMLLLMVAVKHPYIGRRLLIMLPTLLVMSVLIFTVIQLPPGDFVDTLILQMQERGKETDLQMIDDFKEMFYLNDPMPVRYLRWMGLKWFVTFEPADAGLLQGFLGRSMDNNQRPVNQLVGDRILLTLLVSMGTILFTWALAIPVGIYSAVRQYSLGDYILTFLAFFGMCIPPFLLALLLMYASEQWLGFSVTGLFSSEYASQPDWTLGKVLDLLKHIWVPVVILGMGGTAWMVRVMRANLLDELRKPYVVTARAKGVRPMKLLLKYPVRLALNPFISGIGGLFPQLISGGAIVAYVLSLPTVGPQLLGSLMNEDMYYAGSMLMVLSVLGVLGTLVSDLLLLWLDPRIRFSGGSR